jgi:GAF domain-containing protein
MIVDDLTRDPRFARAIAEDSGYVPTAMMLAPLLHGERTLGVLSVLDRGRTDRATLQELELLVSFADQAAVAVNLEAAAQRAAGVLEGETGDDAGAVARLAGAVGALEGERREAALRLVTALADVLEQ